MYVQELLLPRAPQTPASSDSLAALEDAAGQCLLQGRPLQATDFIQQAIDLRRGLDSDIVSPGCLTYIQASVKAVAAVAMGMLETGDLNLSLQVFERLEEVLKGCPLAAVVSERCAVLNNLACVCRKAGQLPVAKRHLAKALRLCDMFKDSEIDRAGTHLNMCAVLSNLGRHGAALEYGKKAVQYAQEEVIGKKSLDTDEEGKHAIKVLAVAYFNVGAEYEHLTAYITALDWYRKAITIIENSDIPALKGMLETLISACRAMRRKATEASNHPANVSISRSRPASAQLNSRLPATRPASASRPSSGRKESKPKRRPSSSKRTVPMPPLSATRHRQARSPLSMTPQPAGEESVSTTKSGKRLMTCIQWAETEPVASGSDLDSLSRMGVMDFPAEEKIRRVVRVRGNKRRPGEGRTERLESAGRRGNPIPSGELGGDWEESSSLREPKPITPTPSDTVPSDFPDIEHSDFSGIVPSDSPIVLCDPPVILPDNPPDLPAPSLRTSVVKQPTNLLLLASSPIPPLPTVTQPAPPKPSSIPPPDIPSLLLHKSAAKLQAFLKGRVARNKAKMLLLASHRRSQRKLLARLGKRFLNETYGVITAYELPSNLLFVLGADNSCECEIEKPTKFNIQKLLQNIDFDGRNLYFPSQIPSPVPQSPQFPLQITPTVVSRITQMQALLRGNIARRLFTLSQAKISKEAVRKRVFRVWKQLNSSTFGLLTIYRLGPDLAEIVVETASAGREYQLSVPFSGENYEELAERVKFNGAAVVLSKEKPASNAEKPIITRKPVKDQFQSLKEPQKVDFQVNEPEDLPISKPKAQISASFSPLQLSFDPISSEADQSRVEKTVILLTQGEKTLLGFQYLISVSFYENLEEFGLEAQAISLGAPYLHPVQVDGTTIREDFGLSLSMDRVGIADLLLNSCSAVKFRLLVAL